MKKIGFIISSLTTGGAERQTIDLANSLSKNGYDVSMIVLSNSESIMQEKINNCIKIYKFERKRYLDFNVMKKVLKIVNELNLDIVFCVNLFSMMYGVLLKKKISSKIVTILHTTELPNLKEKLKIHLYKRLLKFSDDKIYVSYNQRKYLESNYGIDKKNSSVIYNGIDIEFFKKKNNEKKENFGINLKENDFVMCYGAMLRPEKNHLWLLKVIRELKEEGLQNIKLLIAGDGVQYNDIKNYIYNNNLENNVFMLGLQKDIRSIFELSDIGIIASNGVETFSIAALEQMSYGLPMIMSNIGGANEMIFRGYNGELFEKDNKNQLKKIIKNLYNDQSKIEKMSVNAKKIVSELFTLDIMAKKYIQFIEGREY